MKLQASSLSSNDPRTVFRALTYKLAQRAPSIAEKLMQATANEMTFAALQLDADLPRQITAPNGATLHTTLEKAQPCRASILSVTDPIIFAPDPDRFQTDADNHICEGWLVQNDKIEEVSFTLDSYATTYSKVPLYLVGYIEEWKAPNQLSPAALDSASFLAKSQESASNFHATCYQIRMKTDHDPWSNEECEVYTHPPTSGSNTYYNYQTGLLFDGISHYDAAGRYVYFPDVNNSNIYSISHGIAFFQLTSQNQGWIAIEDDDQAGVHLSNWDLPGYPPCEYCVIGKGLWVHVQKADGSAIWGTTRYFWYWYYPPATNHDDVWSSGAFEQFTLNWNPSGQLWYALNDNDFWMRRSSF